MNRACLPNNQNKHENYPMRAIPQRREKLSDRLKTIFFRINKIILGPLLLMAVLMARGQEYVPIIQDNAVWSVSHQKFTLMGDTLINDLTYKKLYYHDSIPDFTPEKLKYVAALRESIEDRKVWMIFRNMDSEKLLYDFSLLPGDKSLITTLFLFFDYELSDFFVEQEIEILSVDEIDINGDLRKRLFLKSQFTNWEYEYWIEGIGSSSGLVYPGNSLSIFGIADYGYPNLLCFTINDDILFQNELFDSCYHSITNVGTREIQKSSNVLVVVNINKNVLRVIGAKQFNSLEVFDLTGRRILQEKFFDPNIEHYLNIGHLKNGIYILRAHTEEGYTTIKFTKPID